MKATTFFWIIFGVSAYAMYYIYAAYLMDILIALLLSIATFGLYNTLSKYIKYPIVCAFISVCILVLFLVVPLFFLIKSIITSTTELTLNAAAFNAFVEGSKEQILSLFHSFPDIQQKIEIALTNISASSILSYVFNFSSQLGKSSLGFMIDTGFIIVFLFFYFLYGKQAYAYIIELIPFENSQISLVLNEVTNTIKVVFYTSVLNIVLQGFAFGVMIIFFGYDGVFFGMLYGLASIVPIVGGSLVWLPIAGYEFYLGHTQNAVIIAIYALAVCAVLIDNIIKPILIGIINNKVLKTSVKINELLIFFAILAGLTSLGFWGIIIAPALTALFISLLRIYRNQTAKEPLIPVDSKSH
ncbi:AI-2E family transporter [Helicobacter japonicus]|uniref:AI-2E family transporter n=2 Tax=Helicobacter japonicus TaxID=425400 RepID=A0A4U8TQ48_9HELI|nr:AI-2E family transporter [Helicobacter japonicus]TLE02256.1 AI-2E family transporter [Helicobacter japonicus]